MFKKLSLLGAILALIVITLGSYLHLSHQGLGCEDWPACYGKSTVTTDAGTTSSILPQIHFYLAATVGFLGVLVFGVAFRLTQQKWQTLGVALNLLLVLAGQIWLGQLSVQHAEQPLIVSAHQLLGFMTLWLFACLYWRSFPALPRPRALTALNVWVWLAQLLLIVEILLGGWASNNLGGLACQDFPRCNGRFWPEGDIAAAFNLYGAADSLLSEAARAIVMNFHYLLALPVFLILNGVMFNATDEKHPRAVRRAGSVLSVLLLIQITLGVLSIKHLLPLPLVVLHDVFAALLMLPLIAIARFSRHALLEVDDKAVAEITQTVAVPDSSLAPSRYQRLSGQLAKTRGALSGLFTAQSAAGSLLEQIETTLLMADMGIETTQQIIDRLSRTLDKQQLNDPQILIPALKQQLYEILEPCSQPLSIPKQDQPYVILVVGVNGAGKTTSIGKLAHRLQAQGHSVMLAAGDTFRAAAVEQLQTWGERNQVQVVAQHTGADSASVIFDALQSAKAKGIDVLIADTAGRLQTKSNLMDELKKIKRIMSRLDTAAPHEVLLILDAGTGQNALSQARLFDEAVQLTGLALTKLDGTAKGGIIFALASQLQKSIRFIGVGEGINDLQDFDARSFVDALFENH